jgi:hypothetical protein
MQAASKMALWCSLKRWRYGNADSLKNSDLVKPAAKKDGAAVIPQPQKRRIGNTRSLRKWCYGNAGSFKNGALVTPSA